jgi:hypothetical protein
MTTSQASHLKPKPKQALSPQQERFCELVAAGENHTDAYIKAGFKTKRENARKNATRLTTNDDIQKRITELRKVDPVLVDAKMTKEEKLQILAKMIRSPFDSKDVKINDILRAIELHSKLMGHFEPDRSEINLNRPALQSIRERAAEIGYALSKNYNQLQSTAAPGNDRSS